MLISDILKLVDILAWPVVALGALLVIGPQLAKLLSGAKVKLKIADQSIETTLPELQQILEEQAGDPLSLEHKALLRALLQNGPKTYDAGVKASEERKLLRPLRNNGLVQTVPRNAFLAKAKAIELSALGRLYLRASQRTNRNDA
jgi:hypothetical protein